MYRKFYGFREKPFELTPNPAFLYKSEQHQKALTYLEYGLMENVGFIVLTGDVGSGKTTTMQYIVGGLGDDYATALIANTNFNAGQMIRMVLREFGHPSPELDKTAVLENLNKFLLSMHEQGKRVLLIIDEAQNLTLKALEELRMLSNLQQNHHPLIQIILVGQPELLKQLKKPSMQQLAQRVAVHFHLTALTEGETVEYIAHRLRTAGGRTDLFTKAALEKIYHLSKGVPRSINLICQAALVYGFADDVKIISQDIINQISLDKIGIGIETDPRADDEEPRENTVHDHNGIEKKLSAIETAMELLREEIASFKEAKGTGDEIARAHIGKLKDAWQKERSRNEKLARINTILVKKCRELERENQMLKRRGAAPISKLSIIGD